MTHDPDQPASTPPTKPKGPLRLIIQSALFLLGLALFAWVGLKAHGEMSLPNADTGLTPYAALADARFGQLAILVVLTASTVTLNGLLWWIAYAPIRKLPLTSTIGVNAIAHALSFLPMKPSVVFRVLYHNRIDRVPIFQFGGWAFAFAAAFAAALTPAIAAAVFTQDLHPAAWWATITLGALACAIAGTLFSRFLSTGAGWRWLEHITRKLTGRAGARVLDSGPFKNLHSGVFMLNHFSTTTAATAVRLIDALGYGARFWIVAGILGVHLPFAESVVIGVSFLVISVVSPIPFGVREAVTSAVIGALALGELQETANAVTFFVAAVEMGAVLFLSIIAALALAPRVRKALSSGPVDEETAIKTEPEAT